jgi:hypothetical protein
MKRVILLFGLLVVSYWLFFLQRPTAVATASCNEYRQNNHLMEGLHRQNDSLWNYTHDRIEAVLPNDIDTLLKIRLLTLKQVKYITSYRYFKQLPNDVQQIILATGKQDSITAAMMKTIMQTQVELQNTIWSEKNKLKNTFLGSYFINTLQCQ